VSALPFLLELTSFETDSTDTKLAFYFFRHPPTSNTSTSTPFALPRHLPIVVNMVSLWGSKNGEERSDGDEAETNGEDSRQEPRHSGGHEPDERTRLLPPRHDGFLDPDDPAVLPPRSTYSYNCLSSSNRYLLTTSGASELSVTSVSSSS